MRKILVAILVLFVANAVPAQELNCVITVNSDQVGQTNQQIFKTLERSLNDFVNKNKWTNRVYRENERVNARMFITVTQYESDRFEANIQIQSTRPVFNTTYESPVFNYKDNAFNFQYQEFQHNECFVYFLTLKDPDKVENQISFQSYDYGHNQLEPLNDLFHTFL